MLEEYTRFLYSTTSASAGFAGLMFVALSIVNRDEAHDVRRERRTLLAASAFLLLVDVFFVSLFSSLGGSKTFATVSLVMALAGLLGTTRLLPKAKRTGNYARGFEKRTLNLVFTVATVVSYFAQFGLAIALLADSRSPSLVRALIFLLAALLVNALGRAWEVAGIVHRLAQKDLGSE
jgi:uncharacterized membrane protein